MANGFYTFVACVVVSAACAAEIPSGAKKPSNGDKLMRYFGGFLTLKDKAEGGIAVINAQDAVTFEKIRAHVLKIEDKSQICFSFADGVKFSDLKSVNEIVSKEKGKVCILLSDIDGLPALLNLPEARCCIVNVAPLKSGADAEKLLHRVCVEVSRAFCFALQLPYSEFPGGVNDPITSLKALDDILVELPGLDTYANLGPALNFFNITPYRRVAYRNACEEGWAPAPTNDIQKAVWDEIHTPPTKPIKITYDKDKQKPVVK